MPKWWRWGLIVAVALIAIFSLIANIAFIRWAT